MITNGRVITMTGGAADLYCIGFLGGGASPVINISDGDCRIHGNLYMTSTGVVPITQTGGLLTFKGQVFITNVTRFCGNSGGILN